MRNGQNGIQRKMLRKMGDSLTFVNIEIRKVSKAEKKRK